MFFSPVKKNKIKNKARSHVWIRDFKQYKLNTFCPHPLATEIQVKKIPHSHKTQQQQLPVNLKNKKIKNGNAKRTQRYGWVDGLEKKIIHKRKRDIKKNIYFCIIGASPEMGLCWAEQLRHGNTCSRVLEFKREINKQNEAKSYPIRAL